MPDPATTTAHEGGEREMDPILVRGYADQTTPYAVYDRGKLARDWLAMDAEITRLREALRKYEPGHYGDTTGFYTEDDAARARAALAGTSADAGARETVTVWSSGNEADVARWVHYFARQSMPTEPAEGFKPYSVTITVTPGKERGT